MKTDVLTSGYVSMDHIIKIDTPAKVGFTSLVTNQSNAQIFYGGCSVNIAYALCRLGMCAKPVKKSLCFSVQRNNRRDLKHFWKREMSHWMGLQNCRRKQPVSVI